MKDIECVLENTFNHVKDNLNAELLKIDTEKADFVLKPVDFDNGVVFQSLNNLPVNFDPIFFYGVDQVQVPTTIESSVGEEWEIEFSIILSDPQDRTVDKRILRYQRALKQVFINEYVKIGNMRQKVRVRSLNPVAFTLQNASVEYRAIGIIVETTLFQ